MKDACCVPTGRIVFHWIPLRVSFFFNRGRQGCVKAERGTDG